MTRTYYDQCIYVDCGWGYLCRNDEHPRLSALPFARLNGDGTVTFDLPSVAKPAPDERRQRPS